MSGRVRKIFFIVTVQLFVAVSVHYGQEDDVLQRYEIQKERMLGGHYFTPSNSIRMPFILTHVRTSLGIGGISDIRYPVIEIGGNEYIYVQGSIIAALLLFEYQHAVKDWLAVFSRFGLNARIGSSIATLTTQGINYATIFDIGWILKLLRNDKIALSASIQVTNGRYSLINIRKLIDDILEGVQNPSLTTSNNPVYGLAGIKAAYGFNKIIGINCVFDLGYGETIQREIDNEFFVIMGVNADLNLYSVIKTPVSLSFGFLHSNYPRNNNEAVFNSNIITGQINYIGRSDFVLSLDLMTSRELTRAYDESVWINTAMFSMRYLF